MPQVDILENLTDIERQISIVDLNIQLALCGLNVQKSTKYKNILKNNRVAIVFDDLKSIDPWDPRGLKIYGTADVVTRQGAYMEGTDNTNSTYIRISPKKKWSWGIDEPVFVDGKFNVNRTKKARGYRKEDHIQTESQ